MADYAVFYEIYADKMTDFVDLHNVKNTASPLDANERKS